MLATKHKSARKFKFESVAHFWRDFFYHFQKIMLILLIFEGNHGFPKLAFFCLKHPTKRISNSPRKIVRGLGFFSGDFLYLNFKKKTFVAGCDPSTSTKTGLFQFSDDFLYQNFIKITTFQDPQKRRSGVPIRNF